MDALPKILCKQADSTKKRSTHSPQCMRMSQCVHFYCTALTFNHSQAQQSSHHPVSPELHMHLAFQSNTRCSTQRPCVQSNGGLSRPRLPRPSCQLRAGSGCPSYCGQPEDLLPTPREGHLRKPCGARPLLQRDWPELPGH